MTNTLAYRQSDTVLLRKAMPPERGHLLSDITVGLDDLVGFISKHYFDFYIKNGGSKIKFITGRPGTGKTHFSGLLLDRAEQSAYITVSFSAKEIWLHDFREVYLEILRQCDLENLIRRCADTIIRELGYDPSAVREGQTLMDYLSEEGAADAFTRSEIRAALRQKFTRNPLLDNSFAACCSLLTGNILGHPVMEKANVDMINAYMHGDKTVKLSQLRAIGLSPSRVTKHNARHLLRSLAEVVHIAGFSGILVSIDDLEILQQPKSEAAIRYTKTRRDDAYENIRQLIDDIDSMRYIMFVMSFRRDLMDNESYGLKSYQALWFRMQSEVVSSRFNRFADIIDLDRLSDEIFTPDALMELSEKVAGALGYDDQLKPVDEAAAAELIRRSEYGSLGLPYLVIKYMTEDGGADNV